MAKTDHLSIVSLIPSATEIVCALGLEKSLIGISHECDYPESIRGLPAVSEPNLNLHHSGKQIDKAVRTLVERGLAIYKIKTSVLEKLRPDVIVTQDQCEVCAVSLKEVEEAVCSLTLKEIKICTLHPTNLSDICEDFLKVGKAVRREKEAQKLVGEFKGSLEEISQKIPGNRPLPRVLCIEWLSPPMIAGGWIPELVWKVGGEPLLVSSPKKFIQVTWALIEESDPDILFIFPCGFSVSRTLKELADRVVSRRLRSLRAVKDGLAFVCDGNAYFNRPGPRIADSAQMLAELIHQRPSEKFVRSFVRWD